MSSEWQIVAPRGADRPTGLLAPGGIRHPVSDPVDPRGEVPIEAFPALSSNSAVERYVALRRRGLDVDRHGRSDVDGDGTWHFRGTPHYLDQAGQRLGISKVLTDRSRQNQELHRLSTLLGQLCERYHRSPKQDGRAVLLGSDAAQVRGSLDEAAKGVAQLHALAAAAQAMHANASRAFGMEPPGLHYRIACDFDEPPAPSPADLAPIKVAGKRAADPDRPK